MAARLGETIFWASSLTAALLVGLVAFLVISDRRDPRVHREADCTEERRAGVDTVLISCLVGMAIVIWLIGRGALYVLAGT
jgi:archaellum biogenesis protein FlaJ (TadC family)